MTDTAAGDGASRRRPQSTVFPERERRSVAVLRPQAHRRRSSRPRLPRRSTRHRRPRSSRAHSDALERRAWRPRALVRRRRWRPCSSSFSWVVRLCSPLRARALRSASAHYVPADTGAYAELRLDLPGDQKDNLASFMSHFPGFADQASFQQKLDETLNTVLQRAYPSLDWNTDVKPWFGGQVGRLRRFLASRPARWSWTRRARPCQQCLPSRARA